MYKTPPEVNGTIPQTRSPSYSKPTSKLLFLIQLYGRDRYKATKEKEEF